MSRNCSSADGDMKVSRPNILFLFSDQHRADALGGAGHPVVRTPNLDRLAGDPAQQERVQAFRKALLDWMINTQNVPMPRRRKD